MSNNPITTLDEEAIAGKRFVPPFINVKKDVEERIIKSSRAGIRKIVELAKNETGRALDVTLTNTADLGIAHLEPWHVGGSNTWVGRLGTLGWIKEPSTSEIFFADAEIPDDTWVCIIGMQEAGGHSRLKKIQRTAGATQMVPEDVTSMATSSGNIYLFPSVLIVRPKSELKMEIEVSNTGYHELKLIGFAVTYVSNLIKKSYYST